MPFPSQKNWRDYYSLIIDYVIDFFAFIAMLYEKHYQNFNVLTGEEIIERLG